MGMHVAVSGTGLLTWGVGKHGALWTSTRITRPWPGGPLPACFSRHSLIAIDWLAEW